MIKEVAREKSTAIIRPRFSGLQINRTTNNAANPLLALVYPLQKAFVGEFYAQYTKRAFDITLSLMALVLLLPVLIMVAVLVRVKLGSPILFRQTRPGLNGEAFSIIKFRTMTDERDANGTLMPDAVRLTRFGKFLRSTSLDELPELINVLKGKMSLVGPRPLLMQYLDRYSSKQARRHDELPGITGWAQVNGRNAISWEEKFELDVWYVDNISLWLDIKILFMTVQKVLQRDGISQAGHVTVEFFYGKKAQEAE